jgi:hypothetical protein
MTRIESNSEERLADMMLPRACAACGGDLSLRVAPGSAWTYCASCHHLSRPQVSLRGDRLQVSPGPEALA